MSIRRGCSIEGIIVDDARAFVSAIGDQPEEEVDEIAAHGAIEPCDDAGVDEDALAAAPEEHVSGVEVGMDEAGRTPSSRAARRRRGHERR